MDTTSVPLPDGVEDEEEEYVLLDLGFWSNSHSTECSHCSFCMFNTPSNMGLDTLNPILIIDDKIKLIGEYEETIGTCIVFSKNDATPVVHEVTGPSEENLFSGTCIIDPNQTPVKQVKPIARLHKILRFRLLSEDDVEDETAIQSTMQVDESLTIHSQPNEET